MIAVNKKGESLPVLTPDTSLSQVVNGTDAHDESTKLSQGIYRVAVESSVDDAGVHMIVANADTSVYATINTGLFLGNGSIEYFGIEEGKIISVIGGQINITPFS